MRKLYKKDEERYRIPGSEIPSVTFGPQDQPATFEFIQLRIFPVERPDGVMLT